MVKPVTAASDSTLRCRGPAPQTSEESVQHSPTVQFRWLKQKARRTFLRLPRTPAEPCPGRHPVPSRRPLASLSCGHQQKTFP